MPWQTHGRHLTLSACRLKLGRPFHTDFGAASVHTKCCQLLGPHAILSNATTPSKTDVTVKGLVQSVRKQKKWAFAHISDGSTVTPLQAILTPQQAKDLTTGAAVEIIGKWEPSPGQGQENELKATEVKLLGAADSKTYPLQKKYHTPSFLRTIPHLRLRTPFDSLITRLRSECSFLVSQYLRNGHGLGPFSQIQPPLLTSSDCEGAGEVFTVNPRDALPQSVMDADKTEKARQYFFREPAYLTVSTQLHLEAYAASLGSVWTLTPSFRAEASDTPRHLSEFWMLEVEVQHLDSLPALMDLTENMIRTIVRDLRQTAIGQEILAYKRPFLEKVIPGPLNPEFLSVEEEDEDPPLDRLLLRRDLEFRWDTLDRPEAWHRITYSDAISELLSAARVNPDEFDYEPEWGSGLQLEHENFLVAGVGHGGPVFVTDYPKKIKPFYMLPSNDSAKGAETVSNFDLLFPGGMAEVVGGSLREHRLEKIVENMRAAGMIQSHDPTIPKTPSSAGPASDSSSPNKQSNHSQSTEEPPSPYPYLLPHETLENNPLKWYVDLRRYGSAPHGGFGLGFERLIAYLAGIRNVRDVVGFPRAFRKIDA
ncbi:MAG: hypothetical protein Q9227_006843 [Pyrenula ochraceoflavens]